jgi:formate dehydrogenase iron-sulfur subunit
VSTRVYVPCDAAALAVGADTVARAIETQIAARRLDAQVIRNGTRGMFWLEPLVEIETPAGRIAYGPVAPEAVESLFESNFLEGGAHRLCLGPTEEIPYLKSQERLTYRPASRREKERTSRGRKPDPRRSCRLPWFGRA